MTYRVLILAEAKADIAEARTFYRKILKALSKRFTADLKSTVSKIANQPFTFGYRFDDFRTANLRIFPYQIHYIVDSQSSTIVIFAVLHAYRNPNFIKERLRNQ